MKKVLFSLVAMLLLSFTGIAQTSYTMVNSASQLEAGAQYILVGYDNDGQAFVMSYQKTNNRHALTIDEAGGVITATVAADPTQQDAPYEFTLGGTPGAWTIYDPLNDGYLCAPGGGNYLRTQTALDDKGRWTISDGEEGGMVPVSNGGEEQCYMRYNITSTLFGCYKESSNVAAPVYFFKAGGAAEPDPEPSNYPTSFTAVVDGTDVIVVWEDAVGEVLPTHYLVRASTSNIVVPADGTPVANSDMDQNVSYGVNGCVFSGLHANTIYKFAIFPYTNSGNAIDYKTDGSYPVVDAITDDIHYLLNEDFNEDLGVFFAYDAYGDQNWHQGTYQGTTYANMNGYANGAPHQNEDWLIGYVPVSSDMVFNEVWVEFSTAKKFEGDDIKVLISSDYVGQGEPSEAYWEEITDAFDYSTGDYQWVESGKVDISDVIPSYPTSFYIAFLYTSSDEVAASWEIDYVKVTGTNVNAVSEATTSVVSLYPNPAREQVNVMLEGEAEISVYDITGRMLSTMSHEAGEAQLNVSELENGVYFINVRYANGSTSVSKFVKF